MKGDQAIFAGAGMHSQTQPMYTYFYHRFDADGNKIYDNDQWASLEVSYRNWLREIIQEEFKH